MLIFVDKFIKARAISNICFNRVIGQTLFLFQIVFKFFYFICHINTINTRFPSCKPRLVNFKWLSSIIKRPSSIKRSKLGYKLNISSLYLDFFSNFDHVYWSNSFLSPFIDYPYSNIYTKLLSDFYWDKSTGTNNGFISVGFMHASWFGVLAYTIIFIFMIHFLDRISFFSVDRSFVVLFLSIIPLQILLSSADLLTALSTHGLFFSLISIPIVLQFLFGSSRSYD